MPVPPALRALYSGVIAHRAADGSYTYTYTNPWEGPNPTAAEYDDNDAGESK